MADWVAEELELLRSIWPDLEFASDGNWVVRKNYPLPDGWNKGSVDLAIRIPANLPGEQPYAFWVRGGLLLSNGAVPGSYAFPAAESLPFTPIESWGKFSWAPETWSPGSKPGEGTGMTHFAFSVRRRLEEKS